MYFRHSSRVRLRLAMAHARLSQDCNVYIPEPHGLVRLTRRGQAPAVGAEGDARHTASVWPVERCAEGLAALGIPEPHGRSVAEARRCRRG